jgi:taurine dioxygenase
MSAVLSAVRPQELSGPEASGLAVTRLSPTIGAEVGGVDLARPHDDTAIAAIRALLLKHRVLVFRKQTLAPAQHVAFARRFGELEVHPVYEHHAEFPELVMLNADHDKPGRENVFHSDTTFREAPAMGSILRCVTCPEVGGDTIWCDMVLAYERLPEAVKERVAGMTAVHDVLPSFGGRMTPERRAEVRRELPPVEHPIVRTHPETGEKILYVNQTFTTHISAYNEPFDNFIGRERKLNTDNLLLYLTRQAEIPEYQVRIHWEPDTVIFWDNRSTQHYAVQDYFPAKRHMQRATIIGDQPR